MNDQIAYLLLGLVLAVPFAAVYVFRKDLRWSMLTIGGLVGGWGPISEYFFFKDYWHPPLLWRFGQFGGPEDVLFGICLGGLAASVPMLLFRRTYSGRPRLHIWYLLAFLGLQAVPFIVASWVFPSLNSIYVSTASLVATAGLELWLRPDARKFTLATGAIAGGVLVVAESIILLLSPAEQLLAKYFYLYDSMPRLFGLAPVSELLWGVAFGFAVAPLYLVLTGCRLATATPQDL